jgi:host factor-I protein
MGEQNKTGKKIIKQVNGMAKQKNLQDHVLNLVRKEKMEVTIYLMNGVPIKGRVLSFDSFTVLVEVDKKQNMIYKHAVSTIVPSKPIHYREDDDEN